MSRHTRRWPVRIVIAATFALLTFLVVVAFSADSTVEAQAASGDALGDERPVQRSDARPESHPTADHTQFEILDQEFATDQDVTKACLSCHTEAAKQIMATTHWTWETDTAAFGEADVIGKKTQINNFCIGVESNEPRCTSCHTGYGWADDTFDFTAEENVDCLVCHDTTGTYKKFPTGAGFTVSEPKEFPPGSGKVWDPLDLSNIALNIGATSRETCGSCHFNGGGGAGVKHGELNPDQLDPAFTLDVHMATEGLDFSCSDCHSGTDHQIHGSSVQMSPSDDHGIDLPLDDGDRATCQSCHGDHPMDDTKLNDHTDTVACQTCHIPALARGETGTKTWWDWSSAGQFTEDGKPIVTKDDRGDVVYDTKKGDFVWDYDFAPEYVWFNGIVNAMEAGDPVTFNEDGVMDLNKYEGDYDDPSARIYPVKVMRGKQVYDSGNDTLVVPHLFGKDEAAYWKGYDWDASIAAGMDYIGLPYSGEYGFMETTFNEAATHMVAPSDDAVECSSCHSRSSIITLGGFYLPGRDGGALDFVWWTLIVLALVGVGIHAISRVIANRRNS